MPNVRGTQPSALTHYRTPTVLSCSPARFAQFRCCQWIFPFFSALLFSSLVFVLRNAGGGWGGGDGNRTKLLGRQLPRCRYAARCRKHHPEKGSKASKVHHQRTVARPPFVFCTAVLWLRYVAKAGQDRSLLGLLAAEARSRRKCTMKWRS